MKALLICPATPTQFSALSIELPLVEVPFLGQTLLEYWMAHLAVAGTHSVLVLVQDRPAEIEAMVGSGVRWGLDVKVVVQSSELTPEEALLKYTPKLPLEPELPSVAVLDHFPGQPEHCLFQTYNGFMQGLHRWMPRAFTPERVGMREVRPGIWVGTNSRVSAEADLHSPCWVGQSAVIGARAILGPGSIVEDGSFIEADGEVSASWVGPNTFVGRLARVTNSLVWGNRLINWQNGSVAVIPDPFVLSTLRRPRKAGRTRWYHRLGALYSRAKAQPELPWEGLVAPDQNLTHESCPEH